MRSLSYYLNQAKINVAVWMLNRVDFKSDGNQQLLIERRGYVKRLKGCI